MRRLTTWKIRSSARIAVKSRPSPGRKAKVPAGEGRESHDECKNAEIKAVGDKKRCILAATAHPGHLRKSIRPKIDGAESAYKVPAGQPEFYLRMANDVRFEMISASARVRTNPNHSGLGSDSGEQGFWRKRMWLRRSAELAAAFKLWQRSSNRARSVWCGVVGGRQRRHPRVGLHRGAEVRNAYGRLM